MSHRGKQYKQIAGDLASGKDCRAQGLWVSSDAFLIAGLANDKNLSGKRRNTLGNFGHREAEEIFEDINVFFLPESATFFPVSADAISAELQLDNSAYVQQISVLYKLLIGNSKSASRIIIAPIQSLLQHVLPPEA